MNLRSEKKIVFPQIFKSLVSKMVKFYASCIKLGWFFIFYKAVISVDKHLRGAHLQPRPVTSEERAVDWYTPDTTSLSSLQGWINLVP